MIACRTSAPIAYQPFSPIHLPEMLVAVCRIQQSGLAGGRHFANGTVKHFPGSPLMITLSRAFSFCVLGAALALTAACSGDGGPPERQAVEVGFVTVEARDIAISATLAGRTVAYETSEVRPQISGHIRRRLFTEGSFVRAGEPLYQIDPSLYQAAANQAEANLASARANAEAAVARADRLRPLAEMEAVSQQEFT